MPGSIGVGAHGWRSQVCQPWGRNSVSGLVVPKVEAPGHPEHPLLLSDAVVNLELKLYKGQKTHSLRMLENLSIDLCLFINK